MKRSFLSLVINKSNGKLDRRGEEERWKGGRNSLTFQPSRIFFNSRCKESCRLTTNPSNSTWRNESRTRAFRHPTFRPTDFFLSPANLLKFVSFRSYLLFLSTSFPTFLAPRSRWKSASKVRKLEGEVMEGVVDRIRNDSKGLVNNFARI